MEVRSSNRTRIRHASNFFHMGKALLTAFASDRSWEESFMLSSQGTERSNRKKSVLLDFGGIIFLKGVDPVSRALRLVD